jgi:anti-sigma factor RsiW
MAAADERDEQLVHAYLDGELDIATTLMVERKIDTDPSLQKLARETGLLTRAGHCWPLPSWSRSHCQVF